VASCTQIDNLLPAYVDGELSDSEKVILEQHVSGCRSCEALLRRQKTCSAVLFEALGEHRLATDMTPTIMAHLPEMDFTYQVAHEVTWRAKHPQKRTKVLLALFPALAPALLLVLGVALGDAWPPADSDGIRQVGMITYQDGKALRSRDESTDRQRVALRSVVNAKERFETGEKAGLLIGLAGPTQVKVDENTRVKVDHERKISVETGRVWLDVCKHESYFRVTTPAGDITVFGTIFNVEVKDDCTLVTVSEGEVQVQNDVTFTVIGPGQQAELRAGQKPLKTQTVDPVAATSWAETIQPDPDANKLFLSTIKIDNLTIIRGEQVFVLDIRKHAVRTITFEWKPDPFTTGHCGYHIYVADDRMKPLFKAHIDAKNFDEKGQTSFDVIVPDDVDLSNVAVAHVSVLPDNRTGVIETSFTEVAALSF